jgi:hypothetical protein
MYLEDIRFENMDWIRWVKTIVPWYASVIKVLNIRADSKGFRRWCVTFRVTGSMDLFIVRNSK